MKKVLLLTLGLFFVTLVASAQDSDIDARGFQEEPNLSRSLSIYTEASSGQMAPVDGIDSSRDKLFSGSEVEVGLRYAQNFKAAPWVTMGGTLKFITNPNNAYDGNGDFIGNAPDNVADFRANVWVSLPYVMVLLDARGLLGTYVNYNYSLGDYGSIAVGADLEIFFTGNAWYGNPDRDTGNPITGAGGRPISIVDYFGVWVSYGIPIGAGFAFNTTAQFRFGANPWNGWNAVEFDPLSSFEIRWNNTVSYNVDGWGFFVQLRLSAYGLAGASTPYINSLDKEPLLVFQTIAGINYTFDFSK